MFFTWYDCKKKAGAGIINVCIFCPKPVLSHINIYNYKKAELLCLWHNYMDHMRRIDQVQEKQQNQSSFPQYIYVYVTKPPIAVMIIMTPV